MSASELVALLGGVGSIVAALAAGAAVLITRRQLTTLAIQTRAQIFLTLDQRWENDPLLAIRRELDELVDKWDETAAAQWTGGPEGDFGAYLLTLYADRLDTLAVDDMATYRRLFLLCGFFETVGFTAHTEHIPVDHVLSLLGGSVVFLGHVFGLHIRRLLNAPVRIPGSMSTFSGSWSAPKSGLLCRLCVTLGLG